jgi:hypothetical protein
MSFQADICRGGGDNPTARNVSADKTKIKKQRVLNRLLSDIL